MPNKRLKCRYVAYFEWLVTFLDQYDPIRLLNENNPGREYDIEARMMVPLMVKGLSRELVADRIHAIFVQYFGANSAGDVSVYAPIADAMIAKWREVNA